MSECTLNVAFIGHVNSGKSTTAGHLTFKFGGLALEVMRKFVKEASAMGKESHKYAWVYDRLDAEREEELSMDISTLKFDSSKYLVNVIDTPGHQDYITNMIPGVALADCAVLVVSAKNGEFEESMSPNGQTREFLLIANAMGKGDIIVAVNKMDATSPPYSEARFNEVVSELQNYMTSIRVNPSTIPFIPISGYNGDNLGEPSLNIPWFRRCSAPCGMESMGTLLQALNCVHAPSRATDIPLRVSIYDVDVGSFEIILAGKVESGHLKSGMSVTTAPSNKTTVVKNVEIHHSACDRASAGQIVTFTVSGVSEEDIKRGSLVGDSNNNPPRCVKSFIAEMAIVNYAGEIRGGYTCYLFIHTAKIACKFVEIEEKLDNRRELVESNPDSVKNGDFAIVRVEPTEPMSAESVSRFPQLGRFIVRDMDHTCTVAIGFIREVINE